MMYAILINLYGYILRTMKNLIHPKSQEISINCSCGNQFTTRSTLCKNIQIDICSLCHPFYTGKQKIIDTAGRVDNFKKRFGKINIKKI